MSFSGKEIYSHKIKTAIQVSSLIGDRPRTKKVIMCHGTFDVVHPGHVRHLLYAKTKADVLIASLTADAHIKKGNMRPYVPEELRAINLAALEMVDYVLIDENSTPLENIELIKPDYFAKGYEYSAGQIHPKTKEEISIIESYGGEIIFTPGDIVYSSSALLDLSPPTIAIEKLLTLMEAESISFDTLRDAVRSLSGIRVHVVGDTIVDSYTHCSMAGGMTKTPTMSVRFEEKVDYVGGAGIVAKHLAAAGADVTFTTVLGQDEYGDFVQYDIGSAGVVCNAILDNTRPTTNKNAIVVQNYRLLKVDTVDNRSISGKVLADLQHQISSVPCDAVVFSDFRHGVFNRDTISLLTAAIPANVFKVADSQVASRWGNILEFQNFDLITPNEREARFALGDQDSVIRPLALELFEKSKCKTLILKCGDRGTITYRSKAKDDLRAFFSIESITKHLVDAVGAGDALLAYSTLSLFSTGNPVISSILGNVAAGLECEQDGNVPISSGLVLERIDRLEDEATYNAAITT